MSVELARQLCPGLRAIPPDSSRTQAAHRNRIATSDHALCACGINPSRFARTSPAQYNDSSDVPSIRPPAWNGTDGQMGMAQPNRVAMNKLVSHLAATTLESRRRCVRSIPAPSKAFLAPLPATVAAGTQRMQASHSSPVGRSESENPFGIHRRRVIGPAWKRCSGPRPSCCMTGPGY